MTPAGPFTSAGLSADVPVPTGSQASAFDEWSIETLGVPQPVLMENAGRAAAQVLERIFPEGRVLVVAGSGNNGGDAWVLARTLRSWRREVVLFAAPTTSHERLAHGWDLDVRPIETHAGSSWPQAEVVVDGLLGTGLRGPPRDREARVIEWINAARGGVVALDVPSGVQADTGEAPGQAVEADVTVAFGAPKLGLLLQPGRARAGRVVAVDIGFPPPEGRLGGGTMLSTAWARAHRFERPPVTHKKAVGSVLVAAGGPGMAGAGILAARAALRAGVGLIRIVSDPVNRDAYQAAVPEALFVDRTDSGAVSAAAEACPAWVLGPGYGVVEHRAQELLPLLELPTASVVLDADALTMVAQGLLPPLPEWGGRHRLIVTPHPGELARLHTFAGGAPDHVRLNAALTGAEAWEATVVAKGAPTVVAGSDGTFLVDVLGSSDLATAGMGDALAGVIGAYAAQGLPAMASAGLALHDTAVAHRMQNWGVGLSPSDVIESLPEAVRCPPVRSDLALDFVMCDVEACR